ncbi:Calpain-7 [Microtus ochrogaster]|uniref:Calpain-7 n=1 Tax=Microtus ochrogaster TaxID=79684 RepID=A0A8J6GTP0_MICOH|nr:Calpain-7 [Microtus ochrogaster]
MDATALERDAVQFARLAVQRDHEGRYSEAVFYYKEAAQALIYAEMAGSNLERIQEKISEYLERVQALHSAVQSKSADPLKSKHQLDLERAHFLVTQAFDEDEKGNVEDAIELYTEAVDLCLKTTIVSDCSFVASLAISAAYERRFNKKLITSIIYPQNKDGEPEYNPCGKYMVKLHLNGVPRKVIIDDQLPVDHKGELLCSYSNNKSELWVSLIEKAYMKVMGGYDFPGSNSNIDLHALTGWIPERIAMHSDSQTFSKDNSFRMLYQRHVFHKGDVLITASTGMMTEAEGEKWGLVPTHAYAVLDIREFKGLRFIQLKNPWSHLRWKGRYSENDVKNWTPELQKYLNFDPRTAQKIDNGKYLFVTLIPFWDWEDDFANNREFITMVVYKTDGKKVYYPADPPPYIDGIRINSPHYLTKIKLTTPGTHTFTLVVSQYEKQNTIHYTVRVYSACSFTFSKIPSPYTLSKRINGKWSGQSAGGCGNFQETHKNNPIYQFHIDKTGPLLIELRGPRQYSVGFEVVAVSITGDPGPHGFQRKSSGDYRCGFCYLELENIPAGIFNIIPSTFLPKQEGPFFLDFNSTVPIKTTQLQ